MKYRKGEIATILTLGTLIVLGIATLVTSTFLSNQKTSTKTKAAAGSCKVLDANRNPTGIGQTCDNLNKCDIKGGCNPACCKENSDCPNSQTCTIADNGYCQTNTSCDSKSGVSPSGGSGNLTSTSLPPSSNDGCFRLTAEIYSDDKKTFNFWIKFWQINGGSHFNIQRNGVPVFNNVFSGANPYAIPPERTGSVNLPEGTYTFLGGADYCPTGVNGMGQATLTCTVKGDGTTASVSGQGCEAKNFTNTIPANLPTPTPTTATKTSGGKTAATPTPAKKRCEESGGTCVSRKEKDANYPVNQFTCKFNGMDCTSPNNYCCTAVSTAVSPIPTTTCELTVQVMKNSEGLKDVKISVFKGNIGDEKSYVGDKITDDLGNAVFVNSFSRGFLTIVADGYGVQYYELIPPNCKVQFIPSQTPAPITDKSTQAPTFCTDTRLDSVMNCPNTDKINVQGKTVIRYVQCGINKQETDPCTIRCVKEEDKNQRAECYGGEFTDNRLIWGPADFTVTVINSLKEKIKLKSIFILTYGLGGTGKSKLDKVDKELAPGEIYSKLEEGVSCNDEIMRGGRDVEIIYTKSGQKKGEGSSTISIQAGCDSRPVITIAQ